MNASRFKFRAWSKDKKRWVDFIKVNTDGRHEILLFGDSSPESRDDLVVCQSTGLLDKNGKEIFEGDIVTYHGVTRCGDEEYDRKEVVTWGNGSFFPLPFDCEEQDEWYSVKVSDYQVIGNIYDNPDLVK